MRINSMEYVVYAWLVILTLFCVVLLKLQLMAKDIIEELIEIQKDGK